MPEPENPDLFFGPKDLKIELCKGSGPGGSNVNVIISQKFSRNKILLRNLH